MKEYEGCGRGKDFSGNNNIIYGLFLTQSYGIASEEMVLFHFHIMDKLEQGLSLLPKTKTIKHFC